MSNLSQILADSNWGQESARINQNFQNLNADLEKVKSATTKFKGYFISETGLKSKYPSPKEGDTAWVGEPYPGTVYDVQTDGQWHNTGKAPDTGSVELQDYAKKAELTELEGQLGYDINTFNGRLFESEKNITSYTSFGYVKGGQNGVNLYESTVRDISNDSNHLLSSPIPIKPGIEYAYKGQVYQAAYAVGWYDINFNLIRAEGQNIDNENNENIFIAPENACYALTSCMNGSKSSFYPKKSYYLSRYIDNTILMNDNLQDIIGDKQNGEEINITKNKGYYINKKGVIGSYSSTPTYFYSEPIQVVAGELLIINAQGYNDNVSIISSKENETYTPLIVSQCEGNKSYDKVYYYIAEKDMNIVISSTDTDTFYIKKIKYYAGITRLIQYQSDLLNLRIKNEKLIYVDTINDKDNKPISLSDITTSNGVYLKSNAEIGFGAKYGITDKFYIKGLKKIYWYGHLFIDAISISAIAFFDENKKFISSITVGKDGTYTSETRYIEANIPEGAYYAQSCTINEAKNFSVKIDFSNVDILRKYIEKLRLEQNFDGTIKNEIISPVKETIALASIFRDWGFIGDSLMSGEIVYKNNNGEPKYVDMYKFSYGQQMCNLCRSDGVNYSSGGLTTIAWVNKYLTNKNPGWTPNEEEKPIFEEKKHSSYLLGLSTNDSRLEVPVGNFDTDVDISDYNNNNQDTFIGNYCKIIQFIQSKTPYSVIFLITMPDIVSGAETTGHNNAIREIQTKFDRCYLIDLQKILKNIDLSQYVYYGHFTTQGYMYISYIIINYLDNIIRNNMEKFNKFAFVNTEYESDVNWSL